ncbi:glycosyltransferase family 4 protein [Vibrio sp. S4M6]|uniref:glycosyltransferase family 4 protein n=1 Tax=Vibrio sinus TaxID=2946865 RepID=UPI00202A3801|nr:glycosyltransferase family 4 protein [Vibrio sinus]
MSKQPSILHICLSKGAGGLEAYPAKVGKEFLSLGYKVYGLCLSDSWVEGAMEESGLETFSVSSKKSLLLTKIPSLLIWLKEKNVEIIHCHKSGDILIAAILDSLKSFKIYFTEHMGAKRPKKSLFHRWSYSHVDQVLSISNETYQRNLKALPIVPEKIEKLWLGTYIPNPQELASHNPEKVRDELGINKTSYVVGCLGRICQGKGQMELLEAIAVMRKQRSDVELLIIGGLTKDLGSEEEFVSRLKKRVEELGLQNVVHFTGYRKDVLNVLSAADSVCLPYYNEAFGLTAIEAMSAQKPIVAANTGALPEVLSDAALLCNPLEPKEIADSIAKFYERPALAKTVSSKAYQRAEKKFSLKEHIAKLEIHYCRSYSH